MTSFHIDAATNELHGPTRRVRVEPQVIRLAAALLRSAGAVMPYSAIIAAMWPPPAGPPRRTAASIRTTAKKLRSALADVGARERLKALPSIGMRIVRPDPARPLEEDASTATARGLTFDPAAMTVRYGRREIGLSVQEVAIMRTLLLSEGGLGTKTELLAMLYFGRELPATADHLLRVRLSQLRRKLRDTGVPVEITATYGVGYRLRSTGSADG